MNQFQELSCKSDQNDEVLKFWSYTSSYDWMSSDKSDFIQIWFSFE